MENHPHRTHFMQSRAQINILFSFFRSMPFIPTSICSAPYHLLSNCNFKHTHSVCYSAFKYKLKFFSFYFNHFPLIETKGKNAEVLHETKAKKNKTKRKKRIKSILKASSKLRTGLVEALLHNVQCLSSLSVDFVASFLFNCRQKV